MDRYDYKLNFNTIDDEVINQINELKTRKPRANILVNLPNTRGISSDILKQINSRVSIRVYGGYDETKRKYRVFSNTADQCIYSRNELIKIVESMEKIEESIPKNWTDYQKVAFVYERLKSGIMYDPQYEKKDSYDIRTLRGLLTRQTVCAGYAIIYKEMLERQGIKCDYVCGTVPHDDGTIGHHAWNLVHIDGRIYPIDLTWDSCAYKRGNFYAQNYFGINNAEFRRKHVPGKWEKYRHYEKELSSFDPMVSYNLMRNFSLNRDYNTTTFIGNKRDKTKDLIAQVGSATINGEEYYRYIYTQIRDDGKTEAPIILYSETNVSGYVDSKNFGKYTPQGYENALGNVLFSKENIVDSLQKRTLYLGKVEIDYTDGTYSIAQDNDEISKPVSKRALFKYPSRWYTRSDGTKFIMQQMSEIPRRIRSANVYNYDCFEIVEEEGKYVVRKNKLYSERDLFADKRVEVADKFLSRKRIDRKASESGGYIGYLDANGSVSYNPELVDAFDFTKKIDRYGNLLSDEVKTLPSFRELHSLAMNYELDYDTTPSALPGDPDIKMYERKTGKEVKDKDLAENALFANIWLGAAGVKWTAGEDRSGEYYAFNTGAYKTYNYFCNKIKSGITMTGNVDSVDIFRTAEEVDYAHSQEIVVNLFKTKYQTMFLDSYFRKRSQLLFTQTKSTEPLYSLDYAGSIAYQNNGMKM